jgi:hypothetical protein
MRVDEGSCAEPLVIVTVAIQRWQGMCSRGSWHAAVSRDAASLADAMFLKRGGTAPSRRLADTVER